MLKVVLLDDERPSLNVLSQFIGAREDVQIVGTYTDPSELLKDVDRLRPDLAFLDIEMPEMNGLELAARMLKIREDIELVFVTAYRQYALEAFRVSAVDYLLKPVEPELLHRTLDRVQKRKGKAVTATAVPKAGPRIVCFGGFEIYKEDQAEPVRFPTVKAEELFAYLLVNRNTTVSKWTLCDRLWPEVPSADKVEHKLHVTMHRMKKTLRENGIGVHISSQRGFYRMECDETCDYVQFEQAVADMTNAENGDPEALAKTIELYKGPLFANRDYDWCEAERERMSRYFSGLSGKLAKRYFEQQRYPQAVKVLLSLIRHEPFHEEAHELLLRTYQILQDRTAFLAHYEKMKKSFMGELGAAPPDVLTKMAEDMY